MFTCTETPNLLCCHLQPLLRKLIYKRVALELRGSVYYTTITNPCRPHNTYPFLCFKGLVRYSEVQLHLLTGQFCMVLSEIAASAYRIDCMVLRGIAESAYRIVLYGTQRNSCICLPDSSVQYSEEQLHLLTGQFCMVLSGIAASAYRIVL